MSFTFQNPFVYVNNPTNSNPVGLGKMYIGLPDTDPVDLLNPANQIPVYAVQPDGSELEIPQPVRTTAGGVVTYNGTPIQLKVSEEIYSVRIDSSANAQLYYMARVELSGGVPDGVVLSINSIKSLEDVTEPAVNTVYEVIGYYEDTTVGGGGFVWEATRPYSDHNGGTIIAPPAIAAWDGTQADIASILNWTPVGGVGCWVRTGVEAPHVNMFGGVADFNDVSNAGSDNSVAFNKLLQSFPISEARGGGKYLVLSAIAPNRKFIFNGEGALICQRTKSQNLWNLNGCSGSEIHYGDYTNNAVLADYVITNAKLIFANTYVEDITIYNAKIFKTYQQGVDLDNSSARINIILCHVEETARDGIFLLDSVDSKVSLCNFVNTGDDSISFAGQSYGAIASSNTIEGAGSFNLGGSGIRFNRSGVAVGNTITNSDLFGIICAVNSADVTARPENLKLIGNTIKGIVKTGTVTAGIGFAGCTDVECINNDIEMPSKEAYAHRIYGNDQSGSISISGGQIKNALAVMYCRNNAAKNISISGVTSTDCTDFMLMDAVLSGVFTVENIEITGNKSINTTNSGYFRFSSSNTLEVENLIASFNKLETPNAIPFIFNSKVVGKFISINDQWATGVFADYNGETNVSSITIDGRPFDKVSADNSVTFNASNSGLISFGATPLARTPLKSDIVLTLESSLGSASYYRVDFSDTNNFRITLDAAPGADVTFSWAVKSYNNRRFK